MIPRGREGGEREGAHLNLNRIQIPASIDFLDKYQRSRGRGKVWIRLIDPHFPIILTYNEVMKNISGQTIQGYELLDRIGAGGFGAVYKAFQSTVGREVAVKVILPAFANKPEFIRRFEMEAQLIARLEHLHIVPLYDFWRDPEGAYIVMRWMRGGSVSAALQSSPFDLGPAALLLDQVAAALTAAHSQEVVHRDIKPSNIFAR